MLFNATGTIKTLEAPKIELFIVHVLPSNDVVMKCTGNATDVQFMYSMWADSYPMNASLITRKYFRKHCFWVPEDNDKISRSVERLIVSELIKS